jgi:mRNA interferase RelE/StbE
MFTIILGPGAKKFLRNANKELQKRILGEIKKLSGGPKPYGSIKVLGEENLYRFRIGKYRVLYEIYYEEEIILIAKIDKRDKVYD